MQHYALKVIYFPPNSVRQVRWGLVLSYYEISFLSPITLESIKVKEKAWNYIQHSNVKSDDS